MNYYYELTIEFREIKEVSIDALFYYYNYVYKCLNIEMNLSDFHVISHGL